MTTDPPLDLAGLTRAAEDATPGPWRWGGSAKLGTLYLSTVDRGRRMVMVFARKGWSGAEPQFQVDNVMVSAEAVAVLEASYRDDVKAIDRTAALRFIAAFDPTTAWVLCETLTEAVGALAEIDAAMGCAGWVDGDDKISFNGECYENVEPEGYCAGCLAHVTSASVAARVRVGPPDGEPG